MPNRTKGMSALTAFAKPYVPLQTAEQVKALPETASIMMACAGCKTLKPIAKKNITAWFSPKVKHDCPGCVGKVFPMVGQTTGTPPNVYTQHRSLHEVRGRIGLSVRQALLTHTQMKPPSIFNRTAG
jgi:hypothetical protein